MLKQARLKLTGIYLVIVITITISFSSFVYMGVVGTTEKALNNQKRRILRQLEIANKNNTFILFEAEALTEVKEKTLYLLLGINLIILVSTGGLAYILSGITLKPIEEAMENQKRFIANAAHELKTPLSAMRLGLEISLRDKKAKLNDYKEVIQTTLKEVDTLSNLTKQLLDKSKQNFSSKTVEVFNITNTINDAINKIENKAQVRNIKIARIDEIQTLVRANKEDLMQLLLILLDNAIKYSKENNEIKVNLINKSKEIVVSIEDKGIGIEEKELIKIFEPFYMINKARSDKESFGLGLAIAKDISDKNSWKLNVQSKVGEGSIFNFRVLAVNT